MQTPPFEHGHGVHGSRDSQYCPVKPDGHLHVNDDDDGSGANVGAGEAVVEPGYDPTTTGT